jgi:hypothetical protein
MYAHCDINGALEKNVLTKHSAVNAFTYRFISKNSVHIPRKPDINTNHTQATFSVKGMCIPMGGIKAIAMIGARIR